MLFVQYKCTYCTIYTHISATFFSHFGQFWSPRIRNWRCSFPMSNRSPSSLPQNEIVDVFCWISPRPLVSLLDNGEDHSVSMWDISWFVCWAVESWDATNGPSRVVHRYDNAHEAIKRTESIGDVCRQIARADTLSPQRIIGKSFILTFSPHARQSGSHSVVNSNARNKSQVDCGGLEESQIAVTTSSSLLPLIGNTTAITWQADWLYLLKTDAMIGALKESV